jgi:hypothetical protein
VHCVLNRGDFVAGGTEERSGSDEWEVDSAAIQQPKKQNLYGSRSYLEPSNLALRSVHCFVDILKSPLITSIIFNLSVPMFLHNITHASTLSHSAPTNSP